MLWALRRHAAVSVVSIKKWGLGVLDPLESSMVVYVKEKCRDCSGAGAGGPRTSSHLGGVGSRPSPGGTRREGGVVQPGDPTGGQGQQPGKANEEEAQRRS